MISLVPLYDARRKGTNGHGKHFSRFSNCDSVLFLSQQNAKLIELSGWAKYSCRALNSTAECSREVPSPARQIQPVVQSRIRLLNRISVLTRASLIATLSTAPSLVGEELAALPACVDYVALPAALFGTIDSPGIRQRFSGGVLYELDIDRDEALLREIPVAQRIVSWSGAAANVTDLRRRLDEISAVPARFYKLVNKARTIGEECLPLRFLHTLDRSDVVAYASGALGFWTRLVALQLGAPAIFGLVSPGPDPREPTITKLIDDYGLPELRPVKEVFAIIGNPIFHSLSPRLHNASYRAMDHPALFLPLLVDSFPEFWRDFVQPKQLDALGFPSTA